MNSCDYCCAPTEEKYCPKCKAEQEARLAAFKKINPVHGGSQVEKAILVWSFYEAPEIYQNMSSNGGDEDWIALVPPHFEWTPFWLEKLDTCMEPQEYLIADGYKILIGSHS